jgi:proliferating cell nuclear antigen
MFEAKLEDATLFRKIIEALKEIIKEGNFECSEPGITFQGVDQSFIALVQLTLRRQGFSHYRVDDTINLGINIENILKLLKCGGTKDSLTLSSQDDSDILSLFFESESRTAKFDHKLMVIDSEALTVPPMNYNTQCNMPSAEFARIVRDLATIGETVQISITKTGITFSVESPTGSGSVTLNNDDGSEKSSSGIKIKVEEEISQKFPLRYLNNFAKAAPLAENVSLKLSPESPFCVDFRMVLPGKGDEQGTPLGALRFFLAPKADETEDE